MKVIVLGTSEFTIYCTQALLDSGAVVCALFTMPKSALPLNSVNISEFAKQKNIPCHKVEDINSAKGVALIKGYNPDYIFSSWPRLLKKRVLALPRICTIGTHPTALPFNRGRHPLHWLIALNIPETVLTFFVMNEKIDAGRVLLQVPFKIESYDGIAHTISKMNKVAYKGVKKLYKRFLADPTYAGVKQHQGMSNYWRKRTTHDITIDLRMSTGMVVRTVRSFSPPYPCANLIFEKYIIKICDASASKYKNHIEKIQRMEHGKILSIRGNSMRVKADDGVVELKSKEPFPAALLKARYIYPPSYYIHKWPREFVTKLQRLQGMPG